MWIPITVNCEYKQMELRKYFPFWSVTDELTKKFKLQFEIYIMAIFFTSYINHETKTSLIAMPNIIYTS